MTGTTERESRTFKSKFEGKSVRCIVTRNWWKCITGGGGESYRETMIDMRPMTSFIEGQMIRSGTLCVQKKINY